MNEQSSQSPLIVGGDATGSKPMRLRRAAWFAIGGIALALGALAGYVMLRPAAEPPKFNARDVTGVPWGKDFQLTDHAGNPRTLADFRGKVVMLFFGFTHCTDVCPTTLAMLAQAMRLLGEDARQVQGLFVTVDPKRDTPEVLAKYVPAFHATFLGLYGDEAATARAAQEFKIYYHAHEPDQRGSYDVEHSGQVYVLDQEGRLRLFFRSRDASPESVAHDLRLLIRKGSA